MTVPTTDDRHRPRHRARRRLRSRLPFLVLGAVIVGELVLLVDCLTVCICCESTP